MTLNRTIAVGILAFAVLGAPASAGTLDDAVSADARGDYAKALRPIRPAANDGDAAAQFYLGTMYVTGHGVQQDYSAAALWFRKQRSKATSSPKLMSGSYIAMAAA
jgi:TPR repeat protein